MLTTLASQNITIVRNDLPSGELISNLHLDINSFLLLLIICGMLFIYNKISQVNIISQLLLQNLQKHMESFDIFVIKSDE